ncbi:carboxy terminal-processing peptidase [Entomomonas sp. E2T0]|uniref:carboxy terminal-processing peptidase n=1 Tax=Entomomonas sp. E2T0 TaxID=2930213 RepID=UPI002228422A|nr:carboxy terminal-processing peptidase [Entomomonas sp. E2T0]UYZ85551.1 carboxy terminal-processing peptidase [Entomomonas sp. E2T0]
MGITAPSVLADVSATPAKTTTKKDAKAVAWKDLKPDENQIITSLNIFEILRRHHYLKLPLDDARSTVVFDSYLKSLDPQRSFFLQSDIDEFAPLRTQFFRLLRYGQLKQGYTIYQRYLERVQSRVEFLLAKLENGIDKIDFNSNETLLIDREKAPWPKDLAEQHDLWTKQFTDDVLRLKLTNKKNEDITSQLTKRYQNQLKRLKQISSEDIFQSYINAFATSYDPHTEYMSPETAENFDINMSLSLEGIGAVLQSDNDYVKIVRLVPAGPAAKSKQLAPADRIVAVGQDKEEMIDIIGWRLEEVVKKIRGAKGSKVQLEVIPASNPPGDLTTKKVTIIREAIKLEDQAAKKSVLNLDYQGKSRKIGIIELPTFYLDFKGVRNNDPNYRSSVRDVKNLLTELKKEKVEGIIIDLRNNGGGSLQEATELTGLFLPLGPAVQVRDSNGQVTVLDDASASEKDGKVKQSPIYNGPLIILVNRLSASASEIFAGAMQDYHRALIVGSQTFGKGTVQSVLPLKHGELKLTVAKFYRVSGQSTQNQGVVPDISYPSIINTEQIGESSLPEAMPWDTINPAISAINNPFSTVLDNLQQKHDERAKNNPDFVYYKQRADLVKKLAEEKTLSLNIKQRKQQKDQAEQELLNLENTRRIAKGDKPIDKLDALETEFNKELEENATPKPEKDGYLVETAHVLLDYITYHEQTK